MGVVVAMSSPSRRHVVATSSPCRRHLVPMSSPPRRHVVATSSSCRRHLIAMSSPPRPHVVATSSSCRRHLVVMSSPPCHSCRRHKPSASTRNHTLHCLPSFLSALENTRMIHGGNWESSAFPSRRRLSFHFPQNNGNDQ